MADDDEVARAKLEWEVAGITERLDHIHTCLEKRDVALHQLIKAIETRVEDLERLRERMTGMVMLGGICLVGVGSVIWLFLSEWVPVMRAMKGLIDKGVGK